MAETPDWFDELPFVHQVVILASFGPFVAILVVTAALLGVLTAPPLLAGFVGFLAGELPLSAFLYDRYAGR